MNSIIADFPFCTDFAETYRYRQHLVMERGAKTGGSRWKALEELGIIPCEDEALMTSLRAKVPCLEHALVLNVPRCVADTWTVLFFVGPNLLTFKF